jgi:hypothetical protein
MGYGLKITNPGNELVLSSDAKGLYCLGKGVQQSLTQPSGNAIGANPGRICGRGVYRFTGHPGPLMLAVDLPAGKNVGLVGVVSAGTNTWDAYVYCGDPTTADAYGFEQQSAVDVWAFGIPAAPSAESYGLRIWDASGNLSWDLTRQPLFAAGYLGGAPGTPRTLPSLSRPVMVGGHFNDQQFDANQGGNTWWLQRYVGTVQRNGTTLSCGHRIRQQWQYFNIEAQFGNEGDDYDLSAFFIEGNLLP